jgi:Anaphase-promoting complex, subunit 10 (APC10)
VPWPSSCIFLAWLDTVMSLAKWASLLDDEGLDDTLCADELQELKAIRYKPMVPDGISNGTMSPGGGSTGLDMDTISGIPSIATDSLAHKLEKRRSLDSGDDLNGDAPLRDLSAHAIWSVSTAKAGNGVEQLLDGSADTYWQSDGPQPHFISAQFSSKFKLSEVRLSLNYEQDESYTPSIISVRAGSSFHDLRVIRRNKELIRPHGWVTISLGDSQMEDSDSDSDELPSDEDDLEVMTAGEVAEREQRRRVRAERMQYCAKAAAAREAQKARAARAARAAQAARSATTRHVSGSLGVVAKDRDGGSSAENDCKADYAAGPSRVTEKDLQLGGLDGTTDKRTTKRQELCQGTHGPDRHSLQPSKWARFACSSSSSAWSCAAGR